MKLTLLTNLQFLVFNDATLHINALLIEEGHHAALSQSIYQLRGFGPDAAWEVFSLTLKPHQFPITWADVPSPLTEFVGHKIPSSIIGLTIPGKIPDSAPHVYKMFRENAERPLDVYVNETDSHIDVWEVLSQKVAQYWRAPFMPYLQHGPPGLRRGSLQDGTRFETVLPKVKK